MLADKPIDKRLLFCSCLIYLSEGISFTIVFPIINEMLKQYSISSSMQSPAEWILLACFIPTQILSGYVHGALSDRFDKKRVVIIGGIAMSLCMIAQGLCMNYFIAVLLRMLCGICNGNVSTAKEYMAKSTTPDRRQFIYSFFGFAWGIGGLVGVVCGYQFSSKRLTADPSILLQMFPFFVAFLICAFFTIMIVVIYNVLLTEELYPSQTTVTENNVVFWERLKIYWDEVKSKNIMTVSTPWQHYRMIQYVILFLLRTHFIGSYAKEDPVLH